MTMEHKHVYGRWIYDPAIPVDRRYCACGAFQARPISKVKP